MTDEDKRLDYLEGQIAGLETRLESMSKRNGLMSESFWHRIITLFGYLVVIWFVGVILIFVFELVVGGL